MGETSTDFHWRASAQARSLRDDRSRAMIDRELLRMLREKAAAEVTLLQLREELAAVQRQVQRAAQKRHVVEQRLADEGRALERVRATLEDLRVQQTKIESNVAVLRKNRADVTHRAALINTAELRAAAATRDLPRVEVPSPRVESQAPAPAPEVPAPEARAGAPAVVEAQASGPEDHSPLENPRACSPSPTPVEDGERTGDSPRPHIEIFEPDQQGATRSAGHTAGDANLADSQHTMAEPETLRVDGVDGSAASAGTEKLFASPSSPTAPAVKEPTSAPSTRNEPGDSQTIEDSPRRRAGFQPPETIDELDKKERKKADRDARKYLRHEEREEKHRAKERKRQMRAAVKAKKTGQSGQAAAGTTVAEADAQGADEKWSFVDIALAILVVLLLIAVIAVFALPTVMNAMSSWSLPHVYFSPVFAESTDAMSDASEIPGYIRANVEMNI
ncbi:hypothetical protein GCM10009786_08660 [Leucobacter alluvii]|uniref:Uncharacterized protein n=1 Tax=Leucobacter alluvii TaxID=340321 RepID=A0ABP5MV51_9MICO